MNHAGKYPYEQPLCATIQLQHRELIASSLWTTILVTEDSTYPPISIESLGYEDL